MTKEDHLPEHTSVSSLIIGFIVGIMIMILVYVILLYPVQQYPEATSFTVIDHDESDRTIYTSDGNILRANKYQWKRLELNKTYVCDEEFLNSVSNCHEVNIP